MALTSEQMEWIKEEMYKLIPVDGRSIGNKTLRDKIREKVKQAFRIVLQGDDYWSIRNALVSDGKIQRGGGLGGSVLRVTVKSRPQAAPQKKYRENKLYVPFLATIQNIFTKEKGINNFVCQINANQGKKRTGGRWTRPDITLVAVRGFQFIPGKTLEVISFEIKPLNVFGVEGVFETAAHSAFAHRSYLAIQVSGKTIGMFQEALERVERECKRFGVGFLTFEKPDDWETYDERIEPPHSNPDPAEVDAFIRSQLSEENQRKLYNLI